MLEIYEGVVTFLQNYSQIYLTLQCMYTIVYSFLMGFVKQEWSLKILLEGLFFPISLQNELGVLTQTLIHNYKSKKEINNEK